jgi:hypothetical protein
MPVLLSFHLKHCLCISIMRVTISIPILDVKIHKIFFLCSNILYNDCTIQLDSTWCDEKEINIV